MEQRKELLEATMRGEHSFAELCRRFGISRKNGYKWFSGYRFELAFQHCRSCSSNFGTLRTFEHMVNDLAKPLLK